MPYNVTTSASAVSNTNPIHYVLPTTGFTQIGQPGRQSLSTSEVTWIPPIFDADTVSVLTDGSLLILAGQTRVRVPVHLFKDLVALAEMELVRRLVPEVVEAETSQ